MLNRNNRRRFIKLSALTAGALFIGNSCKKPNDEPEVVVDGGDQTQLSFPKEVEFLNVDNLTIPEWTGNLSLLNLPWDALILKSTTDADLKAAFALWEGQAASLASETIVRPTAQNQVPFWITVPMALLVRKSNNANALTYLGNYLTEVAKWFPLQLTGWGGGTSQDLAKHDGPWLADSGLIYLAFTLDILGNRISPQIRAGVIDLMQKEIDWIVDCWGRKITWFMKEKNYRTNQWALPTAGLAIASLYIGGEKNRATYNFATLNLAKHLAAQGESGSFHEGYSYANMTMDSVMPAIWAMDKMGDKRLNSFPYLLNYANWHHQMTLSGKTVANFADCGNTYLDTYPPYGLLLAILFSKKPSDMWAIPQLYSNYQNLDIFSHIYKSDILNLTVERTPLDYYAFFANSQLAVWRSSWNLNNAMSLWVKGGTLNDYPHNHCDKGHITVMNGTEPILIETGTIGVYADVDYALKTSSCNAHNVLQTPAGLDEKIFRVPVRAPLIVRRMDAKGGKLTIIGSETLPKISSWIRNIEWNSGGQVTVNDAAILLEQKKPGDEWFRWHIGAVNAPVVTGSGNKWQASWGKNQIELVADKPIKVEITSWKNSLTTNNFVLVIKAAESGDQLNIKTVVNFPVK